MTDSIDGALPESVRRPGRLRCPARTRHCGGSDPAPNDTSSFCEIFVTCQGTGRLVRSRGVAVDRWRLRVGASVRHLSGRRIG
jgi:hypothetical protein